MHIENYQFNYLNSLGKGILTIELKCELVGTHDEALQMSQETLQDIIHNLNIRPQLNEEDAF